MGIFNKKNKNLLEEEFFKEEEPFSLESVSKQEPSHALTPEEVLANNHHSPTVSDGRALDALKKRMLSATKKEENIPQPNKIAFTVSEPQKEKNDDNKTLLEKCKPFITDDKGEDVLANSAPIYELQSVAEILKSDSQKAIERLSEKYSVSFEDIDKIKVEKQAP